MKTPQEYVDDPDFEQCCGCSSDVDMVLRLVPAVRAELVKECAARLLELAKECASHEQTAAFECAAEIVEALARPEVKP